MDWEDVKFLSAFVLIVGAILGTLFLVTEHYNEQGCQYICDGNGDENGYRWNAGCWCRDDIGLYNPEDSRDGRGK